MAAHDPQSSADQRPRKRRRWQFGLSTLLLVVTASAFFSWWYSQESWEEFQQRFTKDVADLGGEIEWGSSESPTRLSFRYWGFSDSKPLTNEKLRSLRRDLRRLGPFTLNLSGSQNARGEITDEGLKHLASLQQLECLALRYTDVTDQGLKHLAQLDGLRFVDVRDTKVGENAAIDARPDVIVCSSGWLPSASSNSSTEWRAARVIFGSQFSGKTEIIAVEFGSRNMGKKPEIVPIVPSNQNLHVHDPEARSCFFSASDVLVSLHGPITDSGVQLIRVDLTPSTPPIVWDAFAEPLGVDHSKYRHDAHVFVHGDRCVLVSDGAATFVEIRDLATGALVKRWIY